MSFSVISAGYTSSWALNPKYAAHRRTPETQLRAWHIAAPGTTICFECAAQHHSTRERSERSDCFVVSQSHRLDTMPDTSLGIRN